MAVVMQFREIATRPYPDQRPGTSGLRKRMRVFRQPHYLENYIQSIFDTVPSLAGGTLVLGGDGRHYNGEALATVLRMAAANGIGRVLAGCGGLMSTPAASALIRLQGAAGGLVLSASHNPGGPDGDFGIKFNVANGGPAPAVLTEAIHARSREIDRYRIAAAGAPPLGRVGRHELAGMVVEVVDAVSDYADLLESLFDFDRVRRWLALPGHGIAFDAMHAVTGPYAREILERRLGAPAGTVLNGIPRPDFGGAQPDPTPASMGALRRALGQPGVVLGAASDGDGDRNLIMGPSGVVVPSDSLAIITAHAHSIPGYGRGVAGVARSMPTSRAVDAVAAAMGIACFETPTGWKYFGNLLDAGLITFCGEESFGTSSGHVREKDGLWAVLYWLNLVAASGMGVEAVQHAHWARFGRHVYRRLDFGRLPVAVAMRIIEQLHARLDSLAGSRRVGRTITAADDFSYRDPVDASISRRQGMRLELEGGGRIVIRPSGTDTEGVTLRMYLEQYLGPDRSPADARPGEVLAPLASIAMELAQLRELAGRERPDTII